MGGEIGAGATLAGTLLGRELTIMGWIANGFGVCVLLLIVIFVASLWHENRKPVTHLVLGALPGDDSDPRRVPTVPSQVIDDALPRFFQHADTAGLSDALERILAEGDDRG